jgi:hypothetical protein
MAARTIEARFERMSVNDENDPGDGTKLYSKAKVGSNSTFRLLVVSNLVSVGHPCIDYIAACT